MEMILYDIRRFSPEETGEREGEGVGSVSVAQQLVQCYPERVSYPHMKQGKRGNHRITNVNPILVAASSPEGTRYWVKGCYSGAALA